MSNPAAADDAYLHGHHSSVVAFYVKRTADIEAAFFLPFVKPGMRLLDVGCGPGTITSGLAQRVEPGETIGIDLTASVIEMARSLASPKMLKNLTFEVGTIHKPRFATESFDAVFAHHVLQHLPRPVDALRQIRMLLKPGGVVGVRAIDWGSVTLYPENQSVRRFLALQDELWRRHGREPDAGRYLRRWFREVGMSETRVTTSTESYTGPDGTREFGDSTAERILQSAFGDNALECGMATRSDLESLADAWRAWGRDSDAFFCLSQTEAVALKR